MLRIRASEDRLVLGEGVDRHKLGADLDLPRQRQSTVGGAALRLRTVAVLSGTHVATLRQSAVDWRVTAA